MLPLPEPLYGSHTLFRFRDFCPAVPSPWGTLTRSMSYSFDLFRQCLRERSLKRQPSPLRADSLLSSSLSQLSLLLTLSVWRHYFTFALRDNFTGCRVLDILCQGFKYSLSPGVRCNPYLCSSTRKVVALFGFFCDLFFVLISHLFIVGHLTFLLLLLLLESCYLFICFLLYFSLCHKTKFLPTGRNTLGS